MNEDNFGNEEALTPQGGGEPDTPEVDVEDLQAQLAKAQELANNYKIRAEKAEKAGKTAAEAKAEPKQSEDFGYGEKAFLKASGITTSDEIKLAQDYMKNTGKSLDEVVESKYFMAELKEMRELKAAEAATPTGSKRAGQAATDQVDYWLAKGELPPASERELRQKVVNARLKKESGKGIFYNS